MAKTIHGSVGKGGANRPEDVVIIQYFLNCVPANEGGPREELALDGICGPKTNEAILRFQKRIAGSGLGWLDVAGPTLAALGSFDPYPDYKLNLSGLKVGEKHGGMPVSGFPWKQEGAPVSSAKDPWGYYNPASPGYKREGFLPGAKFGGDPQRSGVKSGGKEGGKHDGQGWGGVKGAGKHDGQGWGGAKGAGKHDGQGWGGVKDTGGSKVGGKHAGGQSDTSAGKGAGGKNEFGGGRN